MTSCMDKIERSNSQTESNMPEVNGLTNEDKLKPTYMLNSLSFRASEHEYMKFACASVIRNPWYENVNAEKEKTFTIGDKVYKLEYSRTVITERFIADEYTYVKNEKVKFRYFTNSNTLVEIVGIHNISESAVKFSALDDIVRIDSKFDTKDDVIEYSKQVAAELELDLEGLSSSIESIDSSKPWDLGAHIPGFYTGNLENSESIVTPEKNKENYSNPVYQFCVTWGEQFDDGIVTPKYKITVDFSIGISKLIRVEFFPNTPEKEFTVTDDQIIETFLTTWNLEDKLEVYNKEYDVVCNNVASLKVTLVFIDKKTNLPFMWHTVRFFAEDAEFPNTPENVNIPIGSLFPDGEKYNGSHTWYSKIETKE